MRSMISHNEKSEKEMQAEFDARTLADAEEIRMDKTRMKAAVKAAKKLFEEEKERLSAFKSIAGSDFDED